IDEAGQVSHRPAGETEEERADAPRGDLVAGGAQAHRLGLVLVVADGVERQAEAPGVEPAQHRKRRGRDREAEIVEEPLAPTQRAGKERRHHASARADEFPTRSKLSGGDTEPQRGDGEVVATQAEDACPEKSRGSHRQRPAAPHAQEQSGEVAETRVALDDGAGVHPDAEEDDVAERVVAHLSAEQVPGEREDDHHPEEGKLGLVGRRQERQGEQQRPGADVAENGLHARYLRCRESQNRRRTRITTSRVKTKAVWYSAPKMNPAKFSATPSATAEASTACRLPRPATITIMKERTVYGSPREGCTIH